MNAMKRIMLALGLLTQRRLSGNFGNADANRYRLSLFLLFIEECNMFVPLSLLVAEMATGIGASLLFSESDVPFPHPLELTSFFTFKLLKKNQKNDPSPLRISHPEGRKNKPRLFPSNPPSPPFFSPFRFPTPSLFLYLLFSFFFRLFAIVSYANGLFYRKSLLSAFIAKPLEVSEDTC